jgi:hypothetical protein
MQHRTLIALLVLTIYSGSSTLAYEAPATVRGRLAELGRLELAESHGQPPGERDPVTGRDPRTALEYRLLREPREPVREAIDQILHIGTKVERIGALEIYFEVSDKTYGYYQQDPLRPDYFPLLLDLLAKDDLLEPRYTGAIVGVLHLYPSRETALAFMDVAARAPTMKMRQDAIETTAGLLGIHLPIYKQTPPLEVQRILDDFAAWVVKNEDRIAFDAEGHSMVARENTRVRPRKLTEAERATIRKDPACVLRLLQGGMVNSLSGGTTKVLFDQCGDALYGPDAAKVMREMLTPSGGWKAPSLDQQAALAGARASYPMTDAALLAVAYVAAYGAAPGDRELAKTTLDQFGSPDIPRVLKGEPKVVHEKMEELGDEVLKHPEK